MIAPINPASRGAIVAAALFAIGLVVNVRLLSKSLHRPPQPATIWNPATIDAELAPLMAQLPPRCTIGWLPSPDLPRPHDAEPLYLLQYALAPRIVIAGHDTEWQITESPDHHLRLDHQIKK